MKIIDWIKTNPIIAVIIGLVSLMLFFPRLLSKLTGSARRRRRRSIPRSVGTRRRRRSLPRSVGMSKRRRRSGSGAKKAWQVKGSPAARRRMAQLRRLRRA